MTLDPRCEPLLNELLIQLWKDGQIVSALPVMSDAESHRICNGLLEIIDKHLCPCGHNYRKRTIE